jgi:hypothetical protein
MVKTKNRTKENVGIQQASDEILTDAFENLHAAGGYLLDDCD